MKILAFIYVIVIAAGAQAQPANDDCANSQLLCPNSPYSGSNIGATADVCAGCADAATAAGNFCFEVNNTVWFHFVSNGTGGNASVDISGLSCLTGAGNDEDIQAVMIEAGTPCDESTYTQVGNCESQQPGAFTLSGTVNPNTTYYILIDGDINGSTNPAECGFTIEVSGTGVDQQVPTPTTTITTPTTDVCDGEDVEITASSAGCPSGYTYSWMVNGQIVQSSSDSTFNTNALSNGDIVEAGVSCDLTCPGTVLSNQLQFNVTTVTADAGDDALIIQGGSTQLDGEGNGDFFWTPSTGLSSQTIEDPMASPSATTTYTLTVTLNGCTATDQVTVNVTQPIIIPNTITPNGDGYNDTWEIFRIGSYPNSQVSIYDRWGQRVYNTIGYSNEKGWDGTNSGGFLPAGTYYYHIDLNTGDPDLDVFVGYVMIAY